MVAVCVLASVLFIALVSKLVLHLLKGPLESRIAGQYKADDILMQDLTANCFGLESKGVWQLRGNGALVLTRSFLHFFMFVPIWDLRVPLGAITELSITKSHLGKATLYDLLKVRFSENGKPDSIAWYLGDPPAWKERIQEQMAQ
jgi:hypothetical protein